jgi:hypothetical protein
LSSAKHDKLDDQIISQRFEPGAGSLFRRELAENLND